MKRLALFSAILCCSCVVLAQSTIPTESASGGSSTVQVVYVIDGSTLTAYNVDPQTLQATPVGTLTLQQSVYPYIVTSPDGHFLYYTAYLNYSQQGKRLWVYATDANGAPHGPAVQQLNAAGMYSGPQIDPTAHYLYAVYAGTPGGPYTPYAIQRYLLDSSTGKISQPVTEAKYQLASGLGGSEYCGLGLMGFNAAGTEMYDTISCGYHGGTSATYYERTLNTQTGALGPDQQVYGWNNSYGGGERVQFVKNLVFDFVSPNNYQTGVNYVNIYQLQPNVGTPLVNCTVSMLAACGNDWGSAHPSAQYVFMLDSTGATEVDQVNLSAGTISGPTGSTPYEVQQFSPDGTIAYAANDVNGALDIEIYGFNVSTGALTAGGTISVPSDLDSWFAAARH